MAAIEYQLIDIKKNTVKIISFLETDKEMKIKGDLEHLDSIIKDYSFNLDNKLFKNTSHNQLMNIKRSASQNMNFYKNEITMKISKSNHLIYSKKLNHI